MTKKTTKSKSKKRRSNGVAKIVFIAVLCFLSGALTYGILDTMFSKKTTIFTQEKKEISKQDKTTIKKSDKFEKNKKFEKIEKKPTKSESKNLEIIEKPKKEVEKPEQKIIKKDEKIEISEANSTDFKNTIVIIDNEKNKISQENADDKILPPKISEKSHKKPKLAIIMDDISTFSQAQRIKKISHKITPSIFPPEKAYPDTPKISQKFDIFSIHLPMEAISFKSNVKTLMVSDNYDEIERVVAKIRKNFPKAKFINNHTGSKFTGDEKAMNLLIKALNKHNFLFVDSRTIGKTKVPSAVKKYNMKYVYRDVFLDNEDNVTYVRNMLAQAVKIAKQRGFAIAICHPKKSTFAALENSDDLLNGVETVYLDEIYEYY